ncbi:carboxypeptidase B2 isoform X2 [Protopterus annectens]|uniref:carboxypeptidase B2 isoform X2 n=1 Tax=Protopterus annectens TaxID=7888 RepID=UPI001CFC3420|nr:carboxypeptidase B2 isoform X2 [Protopterus annectens]
MNLQLIVFLLTFLVSPKLASELSRDQVLCVTPQTESEVETIRNVTTEFRLVLWQPDSVQHIAKSKDAHLYVTASDVQQLKQKFTENNITYRVMVENTQPLIEKQMVNLTADPRNAVSYYEQYHPLSEIYAWMIQISDRYPELLQLIPIGSSYEKRPLYVLKLYGKQRKAKSAVWIDCGIHAREWVSPAFCQWFVGHDRMWRKNRAKYDDSNCIGTDLNRNFDAGWCGPGASKNPCDATYCGPFPESEPEVRAVARFLRWNKENIKGYITIHSYSQMLLFPYSYTTNKAKDHKELSDMATKAVNAIKNYYYNRYTAGPGAETIYLAPGGSDDWAYDIGIKYSFTFELRDKGQYGFLLPPNLIKPTCLETLTAVKVILQHIKQNVE